MREDGAREARALRQVRGQPNKVWRVLHRVTYVERPAIMAIGRDAQAPAAFESDLAALRRENRDLRAKLDEILCLLGTRGTYG